MFTILGMLAGCAGTSDVPPEKPVNEIYSSAYENLDDENYEQATADFMQVETQFPNSEWAADSLIMAAYAQYLDDDFAGSLMTINRFMRFHPGHRDVAYIMYLKGMNYYRQVSDVRREPGMSQYALQQFQQLVDRFPDSEYAENAKNKINILKNYIAGKVMYSARRDMAKQNWTSAINRLQTIITDAPDTVMSAEAMFRLTECYTALGLQQQVNGYSQMLKTNFPDSDWTAKLDHRSFFTKVFD